MDDVRLYQGDCLKIMKQIPDGSIDLVLTDPPYNIGVQTEQNKKRESITGIRLITIFHGVFPG